MFICILFIADPYGRPTFWGAPISSDNISIPDKFLTDDEARSTFVCQFDPSRCLAVPDHNYPWEVRVLIPLPANLTQPFPLMITGTQLNCTKRGQVYAGLAHPGAALLNGRFSGCILEATINSGTYVTCKFVCSCSTCPMSDVLVSVKHQAKVAGLSVCKVAFG